MVFVRKLRESLSKIVYHATFIPNIVDILKTDEFVTTSQISNKEFGNTLYYVSFSRVKFGGYAERNIKDGLSILVIDGDKLNQKYKGVSINYFNLVYDPLYQDKYFEFEDRLLTDDPVIPHFIDYILEIHIFLGENIDWENFIYYEYYNDVVDIKKICNIENIPLYFYDNINNFKVLNKRKSIDLDNIIPDSYIESLINIIYNYDNLNDVLKDKTAKTYKNIVNLLYDLKKDNNVDNLPTQDIITLDNIIYSLQDIEKNPDKRGMLSKLTNIMKKYKVNNIEDLLIKLSNTLI